jgi:uncharacterized membrane protein YfhO
VITAFGSTRVDVDLAGVTNGLAVLADAQYPGWTAEVDGQQRDIHIVNGVFRGVLVRPGDKLLTFRFAPPALLELLILSLLAWVFSLILVLGPLARIPVPLRELRLARLNQVRGPVPLS